MSAILSIPNVDCVLQWWSLSFSDEVKSEWDRCIDRMGGAVLGASGKYDGFHSSDEEAMNMYLESVYGVDAWVKFYSVAPFAVSFGVRKLPTLGVFRLCVPGLGEVFFYLTGMGSQFNAGLMKNAYIYCTVELYRFEV